MKAQENIPRDSQMKQSPNYVLAIYIIFITALVASYSIVTAFQVL